MIKLVDCAGICLQRVTKMCQLWIQAEKQQQYDKRKAFSEAVTTKDDGGVQVGFINFAQDITSITLAVYVAQSSTSGLDQF